jgi:riboflavin synthase
MFTGLIRETAKVKRLSGNILTLQSTYAPKIGDSIAVNGACLTVIEIAKDGFSVELSLESQKILAMENYKDKVHIEPAMQMGDRFEGHIVQGHVDTVGTIDAIRKNGKSYDVFIKVDAKYLSYIVPKGSITIDGVSLTVNEVFQDRFRLTIIPHTMQETLFATYKTGSRVNIETDMFARYVANILQQQKNETVSWDAVEKISALY